MKSVSASDPTGTTWRVEVRWLPWSPRWRGPRRDRKNKSDATDGRWHHWLDLADPFVWFDEGLPGFVMILVVALLLVIAVLFVLPMFVFVVELIIVGLVVLLGIVLRVLLRRPWLVDAFPTGDPRAHLTWKVVGLGASKRAVDDIARQLAAGVELPHVQRAELARQPAPQ